MNKKFEDLKKIVPNLKVTNPQDLLSLNDLSINGFVKKELVSKLSSVVSQPDVISNVVELGAVIKMIKDILTPETIDIKPFVIKNLMNLEIKSSVNNHTRAYIKARLYQGDGTKYNEATSENLVEIYRKGDLVFKGYIENIKTTAINKDYILEVEAVSQSIKLDDKKFIRSFQDINMTYEQLLEKVFDGSSIQYIIDSDVKSKVLEYPLVQYKETNWEFVKRVFSEKSLELLPNNTYNSVFIGVTKNVKSSKLWDSCISINRNLKKYREIKKNQTSDISRRSVSDVSLSTRKVVLAGERVTLTPKYSDDNSYASSLKGREYSVRNSSIRYENNEIHSHIELYHLEDFIPEIIVNDNIAGVCFTAEVLNCEESKIKVKFDFDDKQSESTAYLFPYISPYTDKDNTGIYFMPEKGDKVLVKFPDVYEKNALVLSAIMTSNEKGKADTKKLTAFDKKIYFQKEDIVIASKDDKTFVKISEIDGISIESDKEISIKADGTTDISSEGDLNLCAQGQINMKVGASKVSMGNGVASTKAPKIEWTSNRGNVKGSRKISEGLGESGVTSVACSDPIDMSTGNFYTDKTDLVIEGKTPLTFSRFFNSMGTWKGSLGNKWQHNFEISLAILKDRTITITYSNGRTEDYKERGNGTIDSITNPYNTLRRSDKGWELYTKEKTKYLFDNNGRLGKIEKSSNETINFTYDREKLIRVANNIGYFDLEYIGKYLTKVTDMTGRSVEYTYFNNNLADIKDLDGNIWQIEYDKLNRIHKMYDPAGFLELENIYDGKDRVIVQITADGHKSILEYNDVTLETKYIERNGEIRVFRRDEKGRIFEREFYSGREKLVFDDNNQVSQYTDKMGNKYSYTYDSFGNIETETNPLGETTKYQYNEQGQLLKLVNPDGSQYSYEYDSSSNLSGTIDPEGRLVLANYDNSGNMSNILFPDGAKTEFTYDKYGNIVELKDPDRNITKYFYDRLNRVKKLTRPNGNEIFYEYTPSGKITRVKFGNGTFKELVYNERGFIAKETDESGYSIKYEYNDSGNLSKRIDQNGNVTRFEYDSLWNISKIIKPDGTVLDYKYDISNHLAEFIDEIGYKELMKYDSNGNMIEHSDKNGNISKREYDALNRVVKVIAPNGGETEFTYSYSGKIQKVVDALKGTEEFEYNKVGELLSVRKNGRTINKYQYNNRGFLEKETDGEENTTSYEYTPSGKLREIRYPDKTKESLNYDGNGNLSVFTDKNGATTKYFYDSKDRLVKVTDPLGNSKLIEYYKRGTVASITDETGGVTKYSYSPTGQLVEVTDPEGNKRTYVYDTVGNLSEIHSFNFQMKKYKPQNEGLITKYLYDKRGLLTKEINPLNLVKTYAYDGNSNLIAITDEEKITAKYEYDCVNNLIKKEFDNEEVSKYHYDPLKRLTMVSTPEGTTKYQYDKFDRLKRVTELNDKVTEYTWRDNGLKDSIVYPNGTKIRYQYKEGKLSAIYENDKLNSKYLYNPQGQLERKELANGIKTQYHYDPLSRITKLDTFDPEEKLLDSFSYTYDKAGNKKRVEKLRDEKISFYDYQYDRLNRITKVTDQDKITESYTYDLQGNRVEREKKDSEGQILSKERYYYDFQNKINEVNGLKEILGEKITGNIHFDYDPRGNVTSIKEGNRTLGSYSFNKDNLLKTATNSKGETTEFKYDGLNRRIGLKVQDTNKELIKEYSYINDITTPYNSILMRYENNLNSYKPQTESYVHGFGLESKESTNTWGEKKKSYYSHNELGSITREYSQEGKTTNSYEYDLFGVPSFREDTHSYTSYTHDKSTGLMYAQARYYLPEVGRFISEDSYKGTLPDPQSQNRYVYCVGNPLRYVDPDGHEIKLLLKGISNVIKGDNSILDLNYGFRDSANGIHPAYEECDDKKNGWEKLPPEMSIYHDNKIGKPELKFVHPDGREAVFDGDTLKPIVDSKLKATYNYVTPIQLKDLDYILWDIHAPVHLIEYTGKGAGHFIFDMVPFFICGTEKKDLSLNPLVWSERSGLTGLAQKGYNKLPEWAKESDKKIIEGIKNTKDEIVKKTTKEIEKGLTNSIKK